MMDGPHIRGFCPDALCITFTSALASVRLVGSVMAAINAETLKLVGLVLLSAIFLPFAPKAKPGIGDAQSGNIQALLGEEIGENPRYSGNREGLGGFAAIRVIVGIRKKQGQPYE